MLFAKKNKDKMTLTMKHLFVLLCLTSQLFGYFHVNELERAMTEEEYERLGLAKLSKKSAKILKIGLFASMDRTTFLRLL